MEPVRKRAKRRKFHSHTDGKTGATRVQRSLTISWPVSPENRDCPLVSLPHEAVLAIVSFLASREVEEGLGSTCTTLYTAVGDYDTLVLGGEPGSGAPTLDTAIRYVARRTRLRHLDVSGLGLRYPLRKVLKAIPNKGRLHSLRFSDCSDKDLETIAHHFPNLVALEADRVFGFTTRSFATFCVRATSLRELALRSPEILPRNMIASLASSVFAPQLRKVVLSTSSISPQDIARLSERCKELQHLELANEYFGRQSTSLRFPLLTVLKLDHCFLPPRTMLSISTYCKVLRELQLISPLGCEELTLSLPELQILELHGNLEPMTLDLDCPKLLVLDCPLLRFEQLLSVLPSIAMRCPQVKTLGLSVSEDPMELGDSVGDWELEALYIYGTALISNSAVTAEQLQEVASRCETLTEVVIMTPGGGAEETVTQSDLIKLSYSFPDIHFSLW